MRNRISIIINIFFGCWIRALPVCTCSQAKKKNTGNETINTIMTRTSVRSFTSQIIEEEKVEQLLRAGMVAPTAMNCQPWEFIVINDRKLLDQLCDSLPSAKMLKRSTISNHCLRQYAESP